MSALWERCLEDLRRTVSDQQFQTWVRPLTAEIRGDFLYLLAPNRFVLEWVRDKFHKLIDEAVTRADPQIQGIVLELSERKSLKQIGGNLSQVVAPVVPKATTSNSVSIKERGRLNASFSFENFVTGKANQLARAAAIQIAEHPGTAYNPLFVYGGVGLGKTHLIHAIGNAVLDRNPTANIRYTHAEQYVSDVIRAYQHKAFDTFKKFYHSLDLLLIDDIQFFGGKNRTQEEFFYAFNALIDSKRQVIITSDTYPKELEGIEDRLISRFGWGLIVGIEPPELEMRVAILLKKAEVERVVLPENVAFFIATHIQSNVRELEGALKRVLAFTRFANVPIVIDSAKEALRDLLAVQTRQISVENIQKTVADYYKVRVAEMFSKKRSRIIARPRQIAMALAKELTTLSLPDIGDAFGGRDHTTVLHACRKVSELRSTNAEIARDYDALVQVLRG
jgi:chromosomal replication initiator protein